MSGIAVGLDGSEASTRALGYAVDEARRRGTAVRAIHAWTTPVWIGGIPGFGYNVLASPDDSKRFAEELIERQITEFREANPAADDVEIRAAAVEGSPRHVLHEASRMAALLVVASHGAGRFSGLLLGSVAQHLLHHADCPVMLVPATGPHTVEVGQVVVGSDGSAPSRAAMTWALDAATRHRCRLLVVHAWQITTVPGRSGEHFVPELREYETESQEWLDKEIVDVLHAPVDVDVAAQLSYSSPTWALREAARPQDLLVVGRNGRGGFPGLLLGSVASQCAHYAKGVVVLVPQGHEEPEPH